MLRFGCGTVVVITKHDKLKIAKRHGFKKKKLGRYHNIILEVYTDFHNPLFEYLNTNNTVQFFPLNLKKSDINIIIVV